MRPHENLLFCYSLHGVEWRLNKLLNKKRLITSSVKRGPRFTNSVYGATQLFFVIRF